MNENADKVKDAITEYNACNYNSAIGTFYHINGIVNKNDESTQQIQHEDQLANLLQIDFNFCKMPIDTNTITSLGCAQADSTAAKAAHAVVKVGQKCVFYDKDIAETDDINADTGLVKGMNLTYKASEICPESKKSY